MSKPKTTLTDELRTIICAGCDVEVVVGAPHNCTAVRVYNILKREAPLGAAGYMSPKHKAETAKAIVGEIFAWISIEEHGMPSDPADRKQYALKGTDEYGSEYYAVARHNINEPGTWEFIPEQCTITHYKDIV